jgi:hypothetical protein
MDTTVYYGGCWSTNIGNAFIDYGAMYLCQKYNPYIYSEMDYLYFRNYRQNYLSTFADFNPKCIFFSGMVTCPGFISDQREIFEVIDRLKIPVVLNGVGGENYDPREVSVFREFIKKHNFVGFISRDDDTYEAYHDLFPKSYKGLDCGFFISEIDKFRFLKDCQKKYTVLNSDDYGFNRSHEIFDEYRQAEKEGSIVRAHHQMTNIPDKYINLPNTLLSEMPDQYIYLYGRTKMLFTTRVHASVATLSFGGKCILLYDTPRSVIFKTVGCGDITKSPCSINVPLFEERKRVHREGLNEIMKDIYK